MFFRQPRDTSCESALQSHWTLVMKVLYNPIGRLSVCSCHTADLEANCESANSKHQHSYHFCRVGRLSAGGKICNVHFLVKTN